MKSRTELIEGIRCELVGPSLPSTNPNIISFGNNNVFIDSASNRRGPLFWRQSETSSTEEVLYYYRESPDRKYGAGLLYGISHINNSGAQSENDNEVLKALSTVDKGFEESESTSEITTNEDEQVDTEYNSDERQDDDFDVVGLDIRKPSCIGVSFCVKLDDAGKIIIHLPHTVSFPWQKETSSKFPVNGRYEQCQRQVMVNDAQKFENIWRRYPCVLPETMIEFSKEALKNRTILMQDVKMPIGSPIQLRVDIYPRQVLDRDDVWLVTVVLRNISQLDSKESILYQAYFDTEILNGNFEKYPEGNRPFSQLDNDEQSLSLLYRDSATWAIGHGCAAGWETDCEQKPFRIYADVMPAVELPSMTPDIEDSDGNIFSIKMRDLATISDNNIGPGWESLGLLAKEYEKWIQSRQNEIASLEGKYNYIASKHIRECSVCLKRIQNGIQLLRDNENARKAFRLANLSMLLQQIASKQLKKRPLKWDKLQNCVVPSGDAQSPWKIFCNGDETSKIGKWRAFQIAFLLMSLDGVSDNLSNDREIVDLIWFPTGGGKTEAYLAVMSYCMFYERLLINNNSDTHRRDGTNAIMRYTLRMLTTQQFQRAANLICSMEFLRRHSDFAGVEIRGDRFSLGLWLGGGGSPNRINEACDKVNSYRRGNIIGNPLVLTECPWCRAEIGRGEKRPAQVRDRAWNDGCIGGISIHGNDGPLLHCSDPSCAFGREDRSSWLPVEVIDERIYQYPPSLIIATVDKLAMIAYRPQAGILFGRRFNQNGQIEQIYFPPKLIIQDELHLISGPIGTMYALYEGVFEQFSSYCINGRIIKPKLIASTATIRGAEAQIKSVYNRDECQLFPSPGLTMGNSFFGKYSKNSDGTFSSGRLYLGIHATNYGSVLTAQVRTFSAALYRPWRMDISDRDPWWTLLVFYNSLRELGGAKTLFDSDIRSRLKFLFNREDIPADNRRVLKIVEELTSRLSQSEIVHMMDKLSVPYASESNQAFDGCLASNIIEVGVDIERLSIMGVVGQPKSTATYIQVTGRVGRKWWERPGLVLMIYNPSKCRDRSHYEQFTSYHKRLYERVEPTTATPFTLAALRRALSGVLITWARQHSNANARDYNAYDQSLNEAVTMLLSRCKRIAKQEDYDRVEQEIRRIYKELQQKWNANPQHWEHYPPNSEEQYLMLWPGQFYTVIQKHNGCDVPTSMRQVDGMSELKIHQGYELID